MNPKHTVHDLYLSSGRELWLVRVIDMCTLLPRYWVHEYAGNTLGCRREITNTGL